MLTHYVFKTCIDVQILLSSAQRMSRVKESGELAGVRYDVHTGEGGLPSIAEEVMKLSKVCRLTLPKRREVIQNAFGTSSKYRPLA